MISYITWKIIELDFTSVNILLNSGIWYELIINELTYSKLIKQKETELFVYHHKTENSENLFWFIEKEEKSFFKELIKISWIGWKVAMQILSLWINTLYNAVKMWDNKTIESIKWIWKKMAEKIILELKDKDFWISENNLENVKNTTNIERNLYDSIKSSLVNMWYNSKEIDKVLSIIPEELVETWEILQFAIKNLS